MTGYQRALDTLNFKETDCTATWGGWVVNAQFFEHVTGRRFWDNPRGVAMEAYRKLATDMVVQIFYLPANPEEWREHTRETIDGQAEFATPESVVQYVRALPDPGTLQREFDVAAEVESLGKRYLEMQEELGPDILCLPQFFCTRFTWFMTFGYGSYLSALALYPDAMERLFAHDAEQARLKNMALAELVKRKVIPPFFFAGSDICGSRGPIVSPTMLRSLYFPYLLKAAEPLVSIGADLIWHCDGYVIPLLGDLVACGITGFQGFQEDTGFDIGQVAAMKTRKRDRPILMAGLSITGVLPHGSVRDTECEVERIIDSVGDSGGLSIGTANTAGPDCRVENLVALYEHTHRYRA